MAVPPVHQAPGSGFFSLPTTRLGRIAAVSCFGMIAAVILVNVTAEPGGDESRGFQPLLALLATLLGLAGVTGAVAVVRNQERSWAVVLPAALILVVVGMELLQGIALLLTS